MHVEVFEAKEGSLEFFNYSRSDPRVRERLLEGLPGRGYLLQCSQSRSLTPAIAGALYNSAVAA
jgi:hypothetical protein